MSQSPQHIPQHRVINGRRVEAEALLADPPAAFNSDGGLTRAIVEGTFEALADAVTLERWNAYSRILSALRSTYQTSQPNFPDYGPLVAEYLPRWAALRPGAVALDPATLPDPESTLGTKSHRVEFDADPDRTHAILTAAFMLLDRNVTNGRWQDYGILLARAADAGHPAVAHLYAGLWLSIRPECVDAPPVLLDTMGSWLRQTGRVEEISYRLDPDRRYVEGDHYWTIAEDGSNRITVLRHGQHPYCVATLDPLTNPRAEEDADRICADLKHAASRVRHNAWLLRRD